MNAPAADQARNSLRTLLVAVLRPMLWLVMGLSIGGKERLPRKGPAIIAANHNSHMDILFLLCAMPRAALPKVSPVAAADYFLVSPLLRFISLRLIGILPLERTVQRGSHPLRAAEEALKRGRILIVFPEGTRGRPEELGQFKAGLTKLAVATNAPIVPVYLQGAGRILPKGARIPVPFTCTMLVAEPILPTSDRASLMASLVGAFERLRAAAPPLHWS